MTRTDFHAIAHLHKAAIPQGFLSSLGERFLANLYAAISRHSGSIVLVERDDKGDVAGFVAGTLSIRQCYRHAITRHALSLGLPVFFKLFSLATLKRVWETLRYPGQKHKQEGAAVPVEAELLAIAVDSRLQGRGAGKRLVAGLEAFFKDKGYAGPYKVVTWALDPKSNGFYKSAGFTFAREFEHHGNKMNEYVKSLKRDDI